MSSAVARFAIMAHLTEKQRIEILKMVGYDDGVQTELCKLFNGNYNTSRGILHAQLFVNLRKSL